MSAMHGDLTNNDEKHKYAACAPTVMLNSATPQATSNVCLPPAFWPLAVMSHHALATSLGELAVLPCEAA